MVDRRSAPSATRSLPGPRSAAAPRRKAFQHPGRIAVVVVALLVVVNLGIVLLNNADTDPGGANPLPRDRRVGEPRAGIDRRPGRDHHRRSRRQPHRRAARAPQRAYLEIPEDQLSRVVELGQIRSARGRARTSRRFNAGQNDVVVLYWSQTRVGGRPKNPASYSWSFEVKA